MSGFAIANYLNANAVPTQATRRGFTTRHIKSPNHWEHSRVLNILRSETYAGIRKVGKRGKGDVIIQQIPPIVSRETWDTAQSLMRQNWSNAPRNAKRDYMLRGLITCESCGRRYVGVTSSRWKIPYYKCNRTGCHSPHVRAELLEQFVWSDIRQFAENPGKVLDEVTAKVGNLSDDGLDAELQEVEKSLARLYEERQTILYRLRKQLVTDEEGDSQLIATGHDRDQLLARKEVLEARGPGT